MSAACLVRLGFASSWAGTTAASLGFSLSLDKRSNAQPVLVDGVALVGFEVVQWFVGRGLQGRVESVEFPGGVHKVGYVRGRLLAYCIPLYTGRGPRRRFVSFVSGAYDLVGFRHGRARRRAFAHLGG